MAEGAAGLFAPGANAARKSLFAAKTSRAASPTGGALNYLPPNRFFRQSALPSYHPPTFPCPKSFRPR